MTRAAALAVALLLAGCGAPAAPAAPPATPSAAATSPTAGPATPKILTRPGQSPVSVAGFTQAPRATRTLPSPDGRDAATIAGGVLYVDGRRVAGGVGPAVWSGDGRVLFFAPGPPAESAMAPEPLLAVAAGGSAAPVRLGTAADPWRLSSAGRESVGFDDAGVLAIAHAGPAAAVDRTGVRLPAGSAGYPSEDSAFLVSPDARYAAVVDPLDHVAMVQLGSGTQHPLPGLPPGDRQQWGAWSPSGTEFLYAAQSLTQRPQLWLWSEAGQKASPLGGDLAAAGRGEYLILGWATRLPGAFLVDDVSTGAPRWQGGYYFLGDAQGRMTKLWTGGFGGQLAPGDGSVTFTWGSGYQRTTLWTARLTWR